MKSIQLIIVTIFVLLVLSNVQAQIVVSDSLNVSDTIKNRLTKVHSPTKAAIFSAAIPGLGQAYNKKYWKIPIIFVGIGTFLYFATSNHYSFKKFKTAYSMRIDGNENTIDQYDGLLSDEGILSNMEYHQRNRDLSYIIAGLLYVLNIVDAAVDAHLFNFPKNDNLSFNLHPNLELTSNNKISKGFKLVINL